MKSKLEKKTNHDMKTPGLNNRGTYKLTHNRFNTHMDLIFIGLFKTESYVQRTQVMKLKYF